ncbi:MAG: alpha/beta fold hydrolase, partial [Pyrinomonadaceae bacterium]|nr:alpha/beta fold hydrolase [Pyrinomonadaceae bacterium]
VLQVAEQMLAGKIALVRGDKQSAIAHLRKAVEAEDALNYNEPADWDIPARESLGGALLAIGDNAEAEKVFRAELSKHPRNGRALFGLIESLKRQGKQTSAQMVQSEFDKAWEKADMKLSVEDLYESKDTANLKTSHHPQPLRLVDVKLKTGVRVHYAEQGDAFSYPVVLLHGYTDSWFSYSRVLTALGANYHVYALDLRGHGDSDRPASGYDLSDLAADVVAFMDANGLKRVTLVGHSMGSFVAQRVAIIAPERIDRLVLVGSATTPRNSTVLEIQQAVNELKDPVPEKFIREFQASTVYHPVPADFMERVVAESSKLPARVWRELMEGMLKSDYRSQLSKLKMPTLILWGDKETVFSRSEQDALINILPSARLKVYADTGHSPHWERPEQFVNDIKSFITDIKPQQ